MSRSYKAALAVLSFMGLVLLSMVATTYSATPSFVISGQQFLQDGSPVRLISGSFHFFRVHPSSWKDRLTKMRACGLNAVQTYVAWNVNEPRPNEFVFEGYGDLVTFLRTAQEVGLFVILRPGPYICAEWDFGGLPAWLLQANPQMRLRTADPSFLQYVDRWFNQLLPLVKAYLYENGGPVVLVQIENEYGFYGSDKAYLNHLYTLMRSYLGNNAIIYSTDPPSDLTLRGAKLNTSDGSDGGVYITVDFGPDDDAAKHFDMQRKYESRGPLMNSEYYTGWITHWGDATFSLRPAQYIADGLDRILALNASVNMYMFVGSTNYGFYAGANADDSAEGQAVDPTSYDYDSPISESGNYTAKYDAVCKVIQKYLTPDQINKLPPRPPMQKATSYGTVSMNLQSTLASELPTISAQIVQSPYTLTMEELGQNYGFVWYQTITDAPAGNLTIQYLRDFAVVQLNGQYMGYLERNTTTPSSIFLPITQPSQLDILVENRGRINFGPYIHSATGITEGVRIGIQFISNYTIYSLPLESVRQTTLRNLQPRFSNNGPSFYVGTFTVPSTPQDTWLTLSGYTKGVVYINGFNIGRYWEARGPQHALYVSAGWLVTGVNELIVFEMFQSNSSTVAFADSPAANYPQNYSG